MKVSYFVYCILTTVLVTLHYKSHRASLATYL